MCILDMTVWWWPFDPEALGNVEYPFIAFTPRSAQTQGGSIYEGSIYRANIQSFTIFETN